jgi:hypothetical protein
MKSCSNCQKKHRNRVTDLCNDCRVTPTYPLCITCNEKKVYIKTHSICKECFKNGLPKECLFH